MQFHLIVFHSKVINLEYSSSKQLAYLYLQSKSILDQSNTNPYNLFLLSGIDRWQQLDLFDFLNPKFEVNFFSNRREWQRFALRYFCSSRWLHFYYLMMKLRCLWIGRWNYLFLCPIVLQDHSRWQMQECEQLICSMKQRWHMIHHVDFSCLAWWVVDQKDHYSYLQWEHLWNQKLKNYFWDCSTLRTWLGMLLILLLPNRVCMFVFLYCL